MQRHTSLHAPLGESLAGRRPAEHPQARCARRAMPSGQGHVTTRHGGRGKPSSAVRALAQQPATAYVGAAEVVREWRLLRADAMPAA